MVGFKLEFRVLGVQVDRALKWIARASSSSKHALGLSKTLCAVW